MTLPKNLDYFRHEVLHTTHVLLDTLHIHLTDSVYCTSGINPEFKKQILNAERAISAAYQAVKEENEIRDEIEC